MLDEFCNSHPEVLPDAQLDDGIGNWVLDLHDPLRLSLRHLKFTACDLYFQNDFACNVKAQSCPIDFARHPALSFTQAP